MSPWRPAPIVGQYPQLEFASEQENCQEQEQNARRQIIEKREAAVRARWSAWRYHIEISVSDACSFRITSDGRDEGFSIVRVDADKEFGVNESLTLSSFTCAGGSGAPNTVDVFVNEKRAKLDWQLGGTPRPMYFVEVIRAPK